MKASVLDGLAIASEIRAEAASTALTLIAKGTTPALAVVLIGGLVIGTLFSLFIVPLVYSLLKRERLNSASSNTDEDVINA